MLYSDTQRAVEVSLGGSQEVDVPSPVFTPGSPMWWLDTLQNELNARSQLVRLYDDYYEGRHKLTFASSQFRDAFASMLSAVSDNWIPLVINASVERLKPQGFLFGGSQDGDTEAWRIWQENYLDADAPLAFTEACKHGEAALLIWPDPKAKPTGIFGRLFSKRSEDPVPRITVEHPSQFVIRREAGDRRKVAAAAKFWQEDDESERANLYLSDYLYKYRWNGDNWQEIDRISNPLGIVPAVPLVNDPQMVASRPPASIIAAPHGISSYAHVGLGRSDQADIISTIDQINKLLCDMLVASEVSAFKQRWVTGLEVPIDPDTGEPVQPFKAAVDRLWIAPPDEDGQNNARFGEFSATDLSNYTNGIESRIQSLAARTRTPPHYLLGSIVNASGDALKAAETGLASKVNGKAKHFGEALEQAIRIAFAWMNDDRAADMSAQVAWGPTESRSESEFVDSLVKKLSIGVPKEQLWKDAGYSPQEIARFKTMLLQEGIQNDIFATPSPDQTSPEPQNQPPQANGNGTG